MAALNNLVIAANDAYFFMLRWCLVSFFQHNDRRDWNVKFLNVGCSDKVVSALSHWGELVSYPAHTYRQDQGLIYPAAFARIASLKDLTPPDPGIYLYLDADSLFYRSVEPLLEEFRDSGHEIGIAEESTDDFWVGRMVQGWKDGVIPKDFPRRDEWRENFILNTGMLLARGLTAKFLGEFGCMLYEKYWDHLRWAEQTILASIIYDRRIPYYKISHQDHCFVNEFAMTQNGAGTRYVDADPLYRGEPITMRHFCDAANKHQLYILNGRLNEKYRNAYV